MINTITVTLTDAQIKALPSGVNIVAAQGAGKMIWPLAVVCNLHMVAPYTGITDASIAVKVGNNTSDVLFESQGFLEAIGDYAFSIPIGPLIAATGTFAGILTGKIGWNLASVNNTPLKLIDDYTGLSNYGGGDSANTLKVTVCYMVVDL